MRSGWATFRTQLLGRYVRPDGQRSMTPYGVTKAHYVNHYTFNHLSLWKNMPMPCLLMPKLLALYNSMKTCGGGDDQRSVWCICRRVSGDIQLIFIVHGPCRQRHGFRFSWVAPLWSWMPTETYDPSWYGEWHGNLLMWLTSIDAYVASGCWSPEHGVRIWRWHLVILTYFSISPYENDDLTTELWVHEL